MKQKLINMGKIKPIGYLLSAFLGAVGFQLINLGARKKNFLKRKKILHDRFAADPELFKKYNTFGRNTMMGPGRRGTLSFPYVKVSSIEDVDNLSEKQSAYVFCLLEQMEKRGETV